MSSRWVIWGVAVLCVALGAAKAYGAEDPETLIRDGLELRRRGDDAKAHGYFQRAYDVGHTPRAAAQLGLVKQALGFNLDAEHYLTEALETQDPWVLQHRAILEKSRQTVRTHLGKVEVHGLPLGATAAWAGQAAQPVPANNVLWVAPGKVTLTFAAPDHTPVTKETSVNQGESVTLDVVLPATPQPVAAQPAPTPETTPVASTPPVQPAESSEAGDSGKGLRIAGLVTAGAGVVAGVTGLFVYRAGAGKRDAIQRDATATPPFYDDSNGNFRTLGNIGIGLMVGGGVALATGAVLYFVGRAGDAESSGEGTHVSFGYAPGVGGRLSLGGSF